MSTGAPKEYFNPNPTVRDIGGLAVRSSIDVCKGCRKCCGSLIKTIAQNRLATGIVISLPMLAMACFLIYIETSLTTFLATLPALHIPTFNQYKTLSSHPSISWQVSPLGSVYSL